MTADTIRYYVRQTLFTDDELQLDEASYSNSHGYHIIQLYALHQSPHLLLFYCLIGS